ncbi:glucose 1-dehydrogenase [Aquipuribacter hungaricus]|uniref:Glucose 1-dehydrogenase n=1 Tax=Aquipuribacter hungaricus TaxID=545624 RepID=A0ABV7WJT2_9MICO
MRALTVTPGQPSAAELVELDEPSPEEGSVLVRTVAVGVCGTDREIMSGEYGEAPPGEDRLVIGHESLGRVVEAPEGSGLSAGDLVVAVVREPDPEPCTSCAVGEQDMCRNGRYTEHGIKGVHGFARDSYRAEPDRLVAVPASLGLRGVLVEPASVLAKAWEHIEHIGRRGRWEPRTVLVTGAGPVGLLAALMGAQRGLEVHVADLVTDGPKPELVRRLGGTYHGGPVEQVDLAADVVLECTGVPQVVAHVLGGTAPGAVVCLAGVSSPGRVDIDLGSLNREWVLDNDVVFGSVNANRRHYEAAVEALVQADPAWLDGMVTRVVPLEDFAEAVEDREGDIKSVLLLDTPPD